MPHFRTFPSHNFEWNSVCKDLAPEEVNEAVLVELLSSSDNRCVTPEKFNLVRVNFAYDGSAFQVPGQ